MLCGTVLIAHVPAKRTICIAMTQTRAIASTRAYINISVHYTVIVIDSVFISIIRIYTRTSTAFTMGGMVLRTIVDIGYRGTCTCDHITNVLQCVEFD